jgi:hypothetical protein
MVVVGWINRVFVSTIRKVILSRVMGFLFAIWLLPTFIGMIFHEDIVLAIGLVINAHFSLEDFYVIS